MRKNQELKSRRFDVSQKLLGQFFTMVDERAVGSEVEELTEDGKLVVRIDYDDDDREDVMSMIELIDAYEAEQTKDDDQD
jgi:hypothetical protein